MPLCQLIEKTEMSLICACMRAQVAPITSPQNNLTHLATRSVWLPPGPYFDTASGTEAGVSSPHSSHGTFVNLSYTLWETPSFARGGLCTKHKKIPVQIVVFKALYSVFGVCLRV